jgi:2-keto-4-pentenoate hydratase
MSVKLSNLLYQVAYLNRITGHKVEPYTRTNEGNIPNVGTYSIDGASYGYMLEQMCSSGGVSHPLGYERCTKAQLYAKIDAFIKGIEEGLRLAETKIDNILKG